jgi:hypothetical protein
MMSGVVEAANKVAEVQNRFVNYAGAFGKDIDKRKELKRAKRKAALDSNNKAIADANRYFRQLDSDINLSGFSPEERKIIKDVSVQWRTEYFEIGQQMAQLTAAGIPLSSPQGQALQDQRNAIQQLFYDVEDKGKKLFKGRQTWAANSELRPQGSDVSNDPYNSENINKANAVWTKGFKAIDPNTAEFYFDYNGENITMEDGSNYTMRPAELMNYLDAEYKKAGRESRQDPFTEAQLEDHEEYINNMFPNDPNVIASVLYSPIMKNVAYDDDIKDRFDDAMDMADGEEKTAAIGAIREEMIGQFVTALSERSQVAADDYAANHPDKPSSGRPSRSGSPLTSAQKQTLGYFKQGKNTFKVSSDTRAVAYDDQGKISILSDGTVNPEYNGTPNAYVIGKWKNGKFVAADGIGRIPAGDEDKFVQLVL